MPSFRGGGAERAMLHFAAGLVELGYPVDVVVAKAEGPWQSEVPSEARIVDLNKPRVVAALPGLVRYLSTERPLAMYATIANANIVAILASKIARGGTKLIIRESNVPLTSDKKTLLSRLTSLLVPLTYPLADSIISVSRGVAEELFERNPKLRDKTSVLATPAVSDTLFELADAPLEHPWFAAGEPPVIIAVGRLHPQKDFSTLLKAFARVRTQRRARLLILGEGGERVLLEQLAEKLGIAEDVSFPGFQDNPFSYLKRSQVYVLSSRYEGMPNVLLQAMACGTPVVATDCKSGPREVLGEDGKLGRLVPVGDVEAMAEAVLEALDSPRREDATAYVSKHFGVARSVQDYLAVAGIR